MNHYAEIVAEALRGCPSGSWREALACFRPAPRLSLSQWSDAHRVVTSGPEVGLWRTARVPYLAGIMDAISDPTVERVVIQSGAQLGKSSAIENAIGFFSSADPSTQLLIAPTEAAARQVSKERLRPMFEASPELAAIVSHRQKDSAATILHTAYPGGQLSLAWASSAVQLASRPVRVMYADELDRWVADVGAGEGDPFSQAAARTSTFRR